jgi:hypothetical protein
MKALLPLFIATLSLLALGNAWIAYKKSTYLEPTVRINTLEIVSNIETIERQRLEQISRRLAAISESDFESLNYLTAQFRMALALLVGALLSCLAFIIWLLLDGRSAQPRTDIEH